MSSFLDSFFKHVVAPFFVLFDKNIVPPGEGASALLLLFFAMGFLILCAFIAWLWIPKRETETRVPRIEADLLRDQPELKEKVRQLEQKLQATQEKFDKEQTDPDFRVIEKLYFAVNGAINSGILLCIGLLVWEFVTLKNGSRQISSDKIVDEIGHMIMVFAITMVFAIVLSLLTMPVGGRSYRRINKAFSVSLVAAVAGFLFFVFR
jgi:hypothetical protein